MAVTINKPKKNKSKKKLETHQGEGKVAVESKNGVASEKVFKVKEGEVYDQPACNVSFKMGHTKNLGNYESLRVDVSVMIPCYVSELEETFEFAKEWVDDRMDAVMVDIEESTE